MEKSLQSTDLKVAIVHDFLLYQGGAERVLSALTSLYPAAPIYTLLYNPEKMNASFEQSDIRTSFLQRWPKWLRKRHRLLLPFYASAVESFDLREYDLVISSSGAWSKGLVTRLYTKHIAYVHSPMRYVWDENERYMRRAITKRHFFARQLLSYLRVWDYQAAQRPDRLIANSLYTQDRIEKYYRLRSHVLYPPVSIPQNVLEHDRAVAAEQPFVIVSRLTEAKNVGVAIDVCNKLRLPLTIIGEGPHREELMKRAGKTVTFTGWCSEQEKWQHLLHSRALLFPAEEDFGIAAVEALGAGLPVIGLGQGGIEEIIEDGIHGVHFAQPTVEVMADGVRRFISMEKEFSCDILQARARIFSSERFENEMRRIIADM